MNRRGITPRQAAEIRKVKGLETTKLQRARVARGYSQGDLAALTGISAGLIRHYEQRTRQIDGAHLETLCNLAIALGCKLEDIVENDALVTKLKILK